MNLKLLNWVAGTALMGTLLVACSESDPAPEPGIEVEQPPAADDLPDEDTSSEPQEQFQIFLNDDLLSNGDIQIPGGYKAESLSDEDGVSYWRISGEREAESAGGRTSGVSFLVPAAAEARFGGRMIEIEVTARGPEESGNLMRIAYSTNGAGNSGFTDLTFDGEFSTDSFTYDSPPVQDGGGDYVGLFPVEGSEFIDVSRIVIKTVD